MTSASNIAASQHRAKEADRQLPPTTSARARARACGLQKQRQKKLTHSPDSSNTKGPVPTSHHIASLGSQSSRLFASHAAMRAAAAHGVRRRPPAPQPFPAVQPDSAEAEEREASALSERLRDADGGARVDSALAFAVCDGRGFSAIGGAAGVPAVQPSDVPGGLCWTRGDADAAGALRVAARQEARRRVRGCAPRRSLARCTLFEYDCD
jgi:hypothetical protein